MGFARSASLPATAVLTFAAVATLAIRERGTNPPALVALGLLVVMVVVTALVNGPINVQELGWNPQAPPADWAAIRDRWQVAHAVRTVACLGALAFLMSAVRGGGAAARP